MAHPSSTNGAARGSGRRLLRIVAWFSAILALVIVVGVAAIHTPPARRAAVSYVRQLLSGQQIEFEAEDLRYNLLDLSATIRNLSLRSVATPDLPQLLQLNHAEVDLSLPALLRGRYVVQSASITGLRLDYVVDDDGRANLPTTSAGGEKTSEPVDFLVARLRASDARVRYRDLSQQIDADLPISSLTVSGDALTHRHTVTVEAASGSLQVQERALTLDRLSGQVDVGDDDVRVGKLDVETTGSRASITGALSQFEDPTVDVRLDALLDAARIAALEGVSDPVSGTVHLDGRASGPLSALTANARVTGRELGFGRVENVNLDLVAGYDTSAKKASVTELHVRAPWGGARGEGVLSLDESAESSLLASVEAIDAASLMEVTGTQRVVSTRVDGRVQATWPGISYRKASGDLQVRLAPMPERRGAAPPPLSGEINATAQAGDIIARFDRVGTPGLETSGRVSLSATDRIEGAIQVLSSDVGVATRTIETLLGRPRGSLVPVPVSGELLAHARLDGTIGSPLVAVDIQAPNLAVGSTTGIAASARAAYTPEVVRVDSIDARWSDAQAHAAGTIALAGARELNVTVSADALRVPALLEVADQASLPVDGIVGLDAHVTGTTASPAAQVNVRASDLLAYGEPFGSLRLSAQLGNREVTVSELALEKPQRDGAGHLQAAGRYHLDQKRYRVDVESDNLRLDSVVLPGGEQLTAALEIKGGGEGTVENPSGALDVTANRLFFNGEELGDIVIRSALAEQQVTISALADRFNTRADARIGTTHPYVGTVTARIDDLDLQTLPFHPETPFGGHISTTVDAAGDIANPRGSRVDMSIDRLSGEWNSRPFALDGPAVLRYAEERVAIERLTLVAEDSTVAVQGMLPLTAAAGEGAIQLDSRLNLGTLVGYAPSGTSLSGEGTITVTGNLRGTVESIEPDLTVAVDNGLLLSPTLEPGISDLTARGRIAEGAAVLDTMTAWWGAAQLTLAARVPLTIIPNLPVSIPSEPGPIQVRANVDGLDPAAIPGAPVGMAGRISVAAEASAASTDDISALAGRITFPELQVGFRELSLAQDQPVTVSIQRGEATIEQFALSGSAGALSASGTVGMIGERALDVSAAGDIDIAAVSAFTKEVRAEGATHLDLTVRGTVNSPDLSGTVALSDATVALDEPRIAAEDLSAHVTLAGPRVTLETLSGQVNGGKLTGSGVVGFSGGEVTELDLEVAANDFAFDAPLELQSVSDSTLYINRREDEIIVDGQVTIKDAGLTGDINFDTGLLSAITARRQLDLTEERSPLLEQVRFSVNVDTAAPIIIDNNLARAEVTADLRVLGTPYETGLSGRLEVLEGGEITLNERRYEVERGVLTFVDERRIMPMFDLVLNTSASSYDIAIAVTGAPGETETSMTAVPSLPEPDIMALLVTGRTLEEMRGEEYDVAREQVLSYLTGRIGSQLGRGVERATGLSEVRIEPNLIANETDPGARLTVGQDLTDQLALIYSTDLTDSNDQIWVAQYDLTRRFETRAVRQDDASYRMDFRHDVRFGGVPEPRNQRRQRPTIASVHVPADVEPGETELRDLLGVEEGKTYDFFKVRRGTQGIERFYRDRGYLQARVRLERMQTKETVDLNLSVSRGPLVELTFEGVSPPAAVREEVGEQWRRGVFDAQRLDDSIEVLRGWLMRDRYMAPTVDAAAQDLTTDRRRVTFRIDPGVRSEKILLAFQGTASVDPDELDKIVDEQDLESELFTDPQTVTELLRRYYREQGFLSARIAAPRYESEGAIARVVLDVEEGPRFMTSRLAVGGTRVFDTATLVRELPLVSGDTFLPAAAEASIDRIRELYWSRGYNDVRSDYSLVVDRDRGQVEVTFTINEGRQAVVADVTVEGNDRTSERLVREQVQLTPSQPLDIAALGRSRKNLYSTGAFSIVDVTREEASAETAPGTDVAAEARVGSADQPATGDEKPMRVRVAVREVQPFQIGYGASFDTERGLGGILDVSNHNSLGAARVIGIRSRYDAQLREARGYINQPSLRYWPVKTTASVFYREERNPQTSVAQAFNLDRRGISIQQEKDLGNSYVWSYGYRYERVRTFDPIPGGRDDTVTLSPLTSTFTRDVRDEPLDASRGSFTSHAFSFSPSWLGSDAPYLKYYGQYFHYVPLQPVRRRPLTNEILRPRLVYAAGVRVGVGKGLDGRVPLGERFFAGGSTSLRGFEQNGVGPIGADRIPEGGEALFVINNELRMPLVSIIDGVIFADIGNVFDRLRDFSLTDLRESAGVGLRLRTPWFLVRGDWGFVLDPRQGERRSRFYFSIGQAF